MFTRRRRPRKRVGYPHRTAGSVLLAGSGARRRRHRAGPGPYLAVLALLLVTAGGAGAFLYVHERQASKERRQQAAHSFVAAWVRGDVQAMYRLVGSRARKRYAFEDFRYSYRVAERAAGIERVRAGRLGVLRGGAVAVPVTVRTKDFGTLYGVVSIPTLDEDGEGRIDWAPRLRLPGLRAGEAVRRTAGKEPRRGDVLAADGTPLAADPIGAGIAGTPGDGDTSATGLERLYEDRLTGHPSATLRFGDRVIRKVGAQPGRSVHTTLRPSLMRAANAALGDHIGGVAVIRPRDGAVLALAGLAVSAPQPPGSTFKIVTLAAALEHRVAKPSSSYPVQTAAVLSGVRLRNAGDGPCGGSLSRSFAASCNSVFGPLGAKVGRERLVAMAERFGFNEQPRVPAAKPASIARDLRDDLAVGAAAIGQERDLATPLTMASVGATIANGGVRVRPRIVREEKVVRKRAVRRSVANQVRDMMVGVVSGGTGGGAALPGITVAGKTGTAELVPTADGAADPKNTDAWFVAFAPAYKPTVAVAVMLVGAGHGGDTAAPIARRVLQAALG
jgi:hypothetical protein